MKALGLQPEAASPAKTPAAPKADPAPLVSWWGSGAGKVKTEEKHVEKHREKIGKPTPTWKVSGKRHLIIHEIMKL